jgi:hypothetical protein
VATVNSNVDGVTFIDCNTAVVTCKVVDPDTNPELAVTVQLPAARALARPEMLTLATLPSEEVQIAVAVMSWVVPSLNVPIAVNCCTVPAGSEGFAGVTAMDDRTALVMVTTMLPLVLPDVTVIVAVPAARAVTKPLLSTVTTFVSEDVQVTEDKA